MNEPRCCLVLAVVLATIASSVEGQAERDGPVGVAAGANSPRSAQGPRAMAAVPDEAAATAKQPVPSAAERRAALARVVEIFGADIQAAKSPDQKMALAAQIVRYVDEASDSATHYVLLETARGLGIAACDIQLAVATGQRLAETYAVDQSELEIDALKTMAADAHAAGLGPVIDALVKEGRASLPDAPARAEELALAAMAAARRAKDRDRGAAANEVLVQAREFRKRDARTTLLLERLRQSPDDAEAALELGRIRCFDEQKWDEGLRFLAAGSDAALASAARADIETQTHPARRLAAADAWCDYGTSHKGVAATAALDRARFQYAAALEAAKGLERARIEKQLESLDVAGERKRGSSSWTPRSLAGVAWWLDAGDASTVRLRGDRVIQWVDKGGGGRAFAQNEIARRPAYLGRINGRRTIAFDGVDDFLGFSSPNESICDATGAAMFVVFKPDNDPEFSVYGQTNNSGRDRAADGKTHHGYFRQERMAGTAGILTPTGLTLLTSRTQAVGVHALRINGQGVQVAPNAFAAWRGSTGEAPADKTKTHTIGVNPDSSDYFKGQIAEMILYGRQLGDQEVAAVERYLKAKWGAP